MLSVFGKWSAILLLCFCLLLPASFQLLQSILAGEADLSILDLHDLDDDGIADRNHVLYGFYPLLVQLGDVNQSVPGAISTNAPNGLMETTFPL